VTVIACSYDGAIPYEQSVGLTIHRMGSRVTVFPRAALRQWRGLVPDADVVLEIFNGISFLTPLWLRTPRVVLVHHIHRQHYAAELGLVGKAAAFMLETAPLRLLYRNASFVTVSRSSAGEIAAHGIPLESIAVNYNGVESPDFVPGPKAEEPTLLYLGRLKRYKRIEWLLDAVEQIPGTVLDIAGEGDHRAELEREIAARGLGDRVRLHGHVDDTTRLRMLQRAWVHITASSAEGWSLAVIEAAACGTPTVAAAAGGLTESVIEGETGLLADDAPALVAATRRVVEDAELRERLAAAAHSRSRTLTWDHHAEKTLAAMERERERVAERNIREPLAPAGTRSLANGVVAANVLALVGVTLIARLVGAADFGALAALVSLFLMVSVPGAALQVGVARQVFVDTMMRAATPADWLGRLTRGLVLAGVAATGASLILRDTIAGIVGVHSSWAPVLVAPAAFLWLVVSVQRGALQGLGRGGAVALSLGAEAVARVLLGLLLVGLGLGVTGALLSIASALAVTAVALAPVVMRHLPTGRPQARLATVHALFGRSLVPLGVLTVAALAQNVDVIVAQHRLDAAAAGAYAAAAVAAKSVVWLAVGLTIYALPEVLRGFPHDRRLLWAALPAVGAAGVGMLAVYAVAGEPLLTFVYGSAMASGVGALPWLGLATGLLAAWYLSVLHVSSHRAKFAWLPVAAALLEPPVLLLVVPDGATQVALGGSIVQLVVVLALAATLGRSAPAPADRVRPTT
jgi:glycosyltransferase involved in cell wall biosynthesis/O-antigen/teichoic acid export membrane protein